MVLIDTVYQRVLALANKEQRGYITPQEFNLFADQAQHEIIEQYFYDIDQFNRKMPGNNTEYSDLANLIDEKLSVLKRTKVMNVLVNGVLDVPDDVYKLGAVIYQGREVMRVDEKEFQILNKSQFTMPSGSNPMMIYQGNSSGSGWINKPLIKPAYIPKVIVNYIKLPLRPRWGYVVVQDKALYDPTPAKTTNFQLHAAEETELVYKILKLAGIAIQRKDVLQSAAALEQAQLAQEKQ
jgi:hypothetical protein